MHFLSYDLSLLLKFSNLLQKESSLKYSSSPTSALYPIHLGICTSALREAFSLLMHFKFSFLALLTRDLTLQRSLSLFTGGTWSCPFVCKKAEKQLSPKPLFFHCGWHKVSTRGNSAKLLHPTEEIKSSAEARLMCQAEDRKPKGCGTPESSRQGRIMIWWTPSLTFQTNCPDSSLSKFEQVQAAGWDKGRKQN